MDQHQFKICPRCKTHAVLTDTFCKSCGREYRTQFQTDSTPELLPPPMQGAPIRPSKQKKPLARPVVSAILLFMLFNCVRGYVRHRQNLVEQDRREVALRQMAVAAGMATQDEQSGPLTSSQLETPSFAEGQNTLDTNTSEVQQVIVNLPALANASPETLSTLLGEPMDQGTSANKETGERDATIKYALPGGVPGSCWVIFTGTHATRFGVNFLLAYSTKDALAKVGLDTESLKSSTDEQGVQFLQGIVQGVEFERITVKQGASGKQGTLIAAFVRSESQVPSRSTPN